MRQISHMWKMVWGFVRWSWEITTHYIRQIRRLNIAQTFTISTAGLRRVSGWTCIVLGLILLPLPIPLGIILLVLGAWMVGTRSRTIRLATIQTRLLIRRMARSRLPLVKPAGLKLLEVEQQVRRQYRQQKQQIAERSDEVQ